MTVRLLSGTLVLLMLVACASRPPAPVPVEPEAQGRVSGELLLDPAAPAAAPAVDEVHESPIQLAGNPNPHYPAQLVAARLAPVAVAVRVVVDAEGKVARVEALNPETDSADPAFFAAVRDALLQWRFEPFRVIQWLPGPDHNGDGEPDGEVAGDMQTRPFRFDMRFRFEVIDGVARVSM